MIYWLVVTLSIIFLGFFMLYLNRKKKHRNNLKVCLCLNKLKRLKNLFIQIQRHRGLTSAYLHGDKNAQVTIQRLRIDLDKQWSDLAAAYPEILEDALYEGVHNHWDRLKVRWESQQLKNNIDQHNRLINNLLFLIENHAEQHIELSRISRASGLDVLWKELLETIEAIGQTRAIGIGVVAAKISSPIERIQLKFLIDKLNRRLAELESAFASNKILVAKSYGIHMAWSQALIREAKLNAEVLTICVSNNLIVETEISVSTNEFFKLASDTIDPLDKIFDEASNLLINTYSD